MTTPVSAAPPMASVATVRNLTIRYGAFTALNDVSVNIPTGCVGLLGPNGAGKTTLIKYLLGFLKATSGGATVMGADLETESSQIRQLVGLMPEQDCHIPGMPAVAFVAYAGELAGMPSNQALRRAHEVLEYCGLGEARYRNVETFSTGMKQRIKLAQALVHGPKLLLLDEPTNGLDPKGREEMLELIRSVSHGKDVNVIVSSHLLKDIERTCDQVVVVVGGQIRMQGMIKDLTKIQGQPVDVELKDPSPAWANAIAAKGIQILMADRYHYRAQANLEPEKVSRILFESAIESGAEVRSLHLATRSLEEAFLEAIKP